MKYPKEAVEQGIQGRVLVSFVIDENGKVCATPVDWDGLIPVTDADGVEWYVTECERHFDDLSAVTPSYAFLKGKGLN